MNFREKAEEWMKKADDDLKLCRRELSSEDPIIDAVIFHAQQAIEKYLKAFLTLHNKPFGKTHNIAILIELCKSIDEEFDELYNIGADKLYPLGVEIRYPGSPSFTLEEAREIVEIAEKVREFVRERI